MQKAWQLTRLIGIIAAVILFLGVLVSLLLNREFNWSTDAIGSLGLVPERGIIFNLAVIISGALWLFFHVSVLSFLKPKRRGLVLILFATAMGSFMMIGLIPSDLHYLVHWLAAAFLFITYPAALLVFSIFSMRSREELADTTLLLMGGYIVSFVAAYLFLKSFALAEVFTAVFIAVWSIVAIREVDKEMSNGEENTDAVMLKSPRKSK